jgi:hypothetical protein
MEVRNLKIRKLEIKSRRLGIQTAAFLFFENIVNLSTTSKTRRNRPNKASTRLVSSGRT